MIQVLDHVAGTIERSIHLSGAFDDVTSREWDNASMKDITSSIRNLVKGMENRIGKAVMLSKIRNILFTTRKTRWPKKWQKAISKWLSKFKILDLEWNEEHEVWYTSFEIDSVMIQICPNREHYEYTTDNLITLPNKSFKLCGKVDQLYTLYEAFPVLRAIPFNVWVDVFERVLRVFNVRIYLHDVDLIKESKNVWFQEGCFSSGNQGLVPKRLRQL